MVYLEADCQFLDGLGEGGWGKKRQREGLI